MQIKKLTDLKNDWKHYKKKPIVVKATEVVEDEVWVATREGTILPDIPDFFIMGFIKIKCPIMWVSACSIHRFFHCFFPLEFCPVFWEGETFAFFQSFISLSMNLSISL